MSILQIIIWVISLLILIGSTEFIPNKTIRNILKSIFYIIWACSLYTKNVIIEAEKEELKKVITINEKNLYCNNISDSSLVKVDNYNIYFYEKNKLVNIYYDKSLYYVNGLMFLFIGLILGVWIGKILLEK